MRKHLIVAAFAALALTACGSSNGSTNPKPAPTTTTTVASLCDDVSAPPLAKTENNVQTLVPTRFCDESIVATADGKVTCSDSVGNFQVNVDGTTKGFLDKEVVVKHYENPDGVNGVTRIDWLKGAMKAHAVIVDGKRWAYLDGAGIYVVKPDSTILASLLNNSDWGGAVTKTSKVEACGWGM